MLSGTARTIGLSGARAQIERARDGDHPRVQLGRGRDDAQPAAAQSQTQQPVCGQTGSMMILFIGSDTSFGEPPFGADSVRLIKADFDAQKVVTVAFPRDLIVDASALEDPARLKEHLGLIFHYAYLASSGEDRIEKNADAASVLAQVMVDNFEVVPEYYLALEMDYVAPVVDKLGGVELTVPQ